ncbi:predicted protein [Lichtheimia corymbifera JMRC:FSU:9682]|uniref:Uncharacterized protein n=1 Tax=Lichtheimia corymbifera JMRC:FSU:9682 TaxID=1263082 RepID=A0A068SFM8_9FUNG|nr:predicted protein [Lichtheimia corymbifera JMRC:FSU:9682]
MTLPATPHFPPKDGEPPDKKPTFASIVAPTRTTERLFTCGNQNAPNPWVRASAPHSLVYELTNIKISQTAFRSAARQSFPIADTCGLIIYKSGRRTIAGIGFNNQQLQSKHIDTPIKLPDDQIVQGNVPVPDTWEVVKVRLTNIPLLPLELLRKVILRSCNPYGHVLECGIYTEQGWFTGTGYAYLNRAPDNSPFPSNAKNETHAALMHTIHIQVVKSTDSTALTNSQSTKRQRATSPIENNSTNKAASFIPVKPLLCNEYKKMPQLSSLPPQADTAVSIISSPALSSIDDQPPAQPPTIDSDTSGSPPHTKEDDHLKDDHLKDDHLKDDHMDDT